MPTLRLTLLALALATVSLPAFSAGARISIGKIQTTTVNSLSAAASAVPSNTTLPDDGSMRDLSRETILENKLNQLIADRLAKLTPNARAATLAPPTLPQIVGLPLAPNGNVDGFAGLTNFDQASVNQGVSTEPPDQMLCVGHDVVFEGVNGAFAVYSHEGRLLAGPAQDVAFFGVDSANFVSDPRCLYDAATDRWFVTMNEYNGNLTSDHLMIAVSTSGDPTGSFRIYSVDVSNDGADFFAGDCPCLGDQPLIGADANGFYVSTNAFGLTSFQGAQIYMISKAALAAGTASLVVHIDQLSQYLPGVEFTYSIQPSTTAHGAKSAKNTEYLAQSMRAHQLETSLAVWSIGNTAAIDTDPTQLTIGLAIAPTQVYVQPVAARQKVGATPEAERAVLSDTALGLANLQNLDGGDQRLQQVTYLKGQLWTTVGTSFTATGSPVRDAVAWFVLNVSNSGAALTASVASQGYVAGPDDTHLIYPALGVNSKGQAAIVFTLTGSGSFPSAAFWKFGASSIQVMAEGQAAQDGFSAYFYDRPRWGDYSAAVAGPNGDIWMATEMIPGGVRKRAANWGTFVGRIHEED